VLSWASAGRAGRRSAPRLSIAQSPATAAPQV